jgi:hypothetical protein
MRRVADFVRPLRSRPYRIRPPAPGPGIRLVDAEPSVALSVGIQVAGGHCADLHGRRQAGQRRRAAVAQGTGGRAEPERRPQPGAGRLGSEVCCRRCWWCRSALLFGYGLLRLSTTLFTELRELVFAKATEGAARSISSAGVSPSARAEPALSPGSPDRRHDARHRARHPRRAFADLVFAVQHRPDADRGHAGADACWR